MRNVDIVEFGSGDFAKISILLENIQDENIETICYMPFDVSIAAVKKSTSSLLRQFPKLKIRGFIADFNYQLDIIPKDKKKLFCFLGSTIGNFSIQDSLNFLLNLSEIMHPNDMLLLGFDMVKDKEILEKAYNDDKNITEKFNKNILNVVNNYIKTSFNPDDFKHIAFFNEEHSRIEMHLEAKKDLEIYCPNLNSNIKFNQGERIHTENSYKYTEEDIKNLAKGSDLELENIYTDVKKWFSVVHLIKN